MPKEKKIRVWTSVTPELDGKVEFWAEKLGVTKSQLINMCLQAGLKNIITAFSPEDVFTPETWAKLVKAMQVEGLSPVEEGTNAK